MFNMLYGMIPFIDDNFGFRERSLTDISTSTRYVDANKEFEQIFRYEFSDARR